MFVIPRGVWVPRTKSRVPGRKHTRFPHVDADQAIFANSLHLFALCKLIVAYFMATQNAATYRSDLGVLVRLLGCAPRTLAELYRYRASNALFEYGVQQQYEAVRYECAFQTDRVWRREPTI